MSRHERVQHAKKTGRQSIPRKTQNTERTRTRRSQTDEDVTKSKETMKGGATVREKQEGQKFNKKVVTKGGGSRLETNK